MTKYIFWFLAVFLSTGAIALTDTESQQVNKITQFYGKRAGMRVNTWQQIVSDNASSNINTKLHQINDFFNQLIFIDDSKLWGKQDYWATPLEFLGVGAGDCEDFSIAKYFSLRKLGIDDDKLRLVYVKALELNQFHMVVAYYPTPSSVPLLLDNLDSEIKPATQRPDLRPIYSFNGSKLWLMKQQRQGQLAGKASRLSLWNDLRQRSNHIKLHKPKINFDE